MRKISRSSSPVAIAPMVGATLLLAVSPAAADGYGGNPYYYNTQTYSHGLNLPQAPLPNGSDEIRAADGTTCKSSMAGNGSYLDVGGIGSQGVDGAFNSGSVYARLIVPLGETPKRIDCTALYSLEIQRLQNELQLVRMGLNGAGGAASPAVAKAGGGKKEAAWASDGWSNSGWKASAKLGASDVEPAPVKTPVSAVKASRKAAPVATPFTAPLEIVAMPVTVASAPVSAVEMGAWKTTVTIEID
ncbi:MAG: hypothetical protein ACT4N2_01345 [Hyphomicrobium sp.]